MATTLRELLIRVGVDANNAKASLAQVDAGVAKVKTGFQNLATFAGAATAAIGAAGLGALLLASQAAAAAKTIDLQSRALGVQVEQYQKLTQAAVAFGLEQQDVAQAMVKTTLALQAGAEGGEAQAEAFKKLGLDLKETLALKPDERLLKLSDAFRQVQGDVDRLALANALFGDDLAVKLLPLLTAGSVKLRELGEEARELGVILTRENIDSSLKFAKAQGEVVRILDALQLKIGIALSPALTDIAERFTAWYKVNQEIIGQKIDEYAEILAVGMGRVADAIGEVDKTIGGAKGWAQLAEYMLVLGGAKGAGMVAGQLYDMGGGAAQASYGLGSMTPALLSAASKTTQYTMTVLKLSHTLGLLKASRAALGPRLDVLGDLGSVIQALRVIKSLGLGLGLRTVLMQAGVPLAAMAASAVTIKTALAAVAVVAAKVAAVLAVVASLFLVFEDVWTWLRGGDSVYGRMLEKMKESQGVLGAVARLYEAMGNVANAMISRVVQYFQLIGDVLGLAGDAIKFVAQQVYDLNAAIGEVMLPYLERVAETLGIEIPGFIYEVADALKAWRDGLVDIIDLLSMALNMAARFIGTDVADAAMKGDGSTDTATAAGQARVGQIAENFGTAALGDRAYFGARAKARNAGRATGQALGTGVDLAALGFKTTADTARSAMQTVGGWAFGAQGSDARNAALAGLSGRPVTQSPVTITAPVTVTIQGNADERTVEQLRAMQADNNAQMLRGLQNQLTGAEL